MDVMHSEPPTRVKIDKDERLGWSSDRPRREGGPPRKPDVSVRCHVLAPSDRLRYSPGSLVLVASESVEERERFADRLIAEKGSVLSLEKVRGLLEGRVEEEQLDAKSAELLDAAIAKRLATNQTVVVLADGLDEEERERHVRAAFAHGRPRHLILVESAEQPADDERRAAVGRLRKAIEAAALGAEGFHTALRLSGSSLGEVKRIVFRPPPRPDDD
jgi:hypothetical protein